MKRTKRNSSPIWLTGATATLAVMNHETAAQAFQASLPAATDGASEQRVLSLHQFGFYHESVLGTSCELVVNSLRPEDACVCEQQVMAEIERLRRLLSIYDPTSEISRVCAGAPVKSAELNSLLSAYAFWSERTGGVINANMGEVIRLWKNAKETAPTPQALVEAFGQPRAFNVDALGKGYIIDRAVETARRFAPGGLLNIGGDIRVWGDNTWQIGVADPFAPAENAPLLGRFGLRNGAVATSGGYSRFVTLDGRRYSHIIDPRTLQPAAEVSSASLAAADCLTANAISTAANILGVGEGVRLAKLSGAWEYLLVNARGQMEGSPALTRIADTGTPQASESKPVATQAAISNAPAAAVVNTTAALPSAPADGPAWPTNFQVKIDLSLKSPPGGQARRPYIAVWVEDSKTNIVRTITLWGSEWRWLRELNTWWKVSDKYADSYAQSITRATRAPGKYVVTWDGLNDKKQPLPQGEYKIFLEINREHGRHATESVTIQCGTETTAAEFRVTPESDACKIEYAAKAQ